MQMPTLQLNQQLRFCIHTFVVDPYLIQIIDKHPTKIYMLAKGNYLHILLSYTFKPCVKMCMFVVLSYTLKPCFPQTDSSKMCMFVSDMNFITPVDLADNMSCFSAL